jgi:subtilase family serine protease
MRPSPKSIPLLGLCLFLSAARCSGQATVPTSRITTATDENKLVTLAGNVHPLARPEFDRGSVSDAQALHRMLLLLQRSSEQESALLRLLEDQQSKASPNYHKWLTPNQFGQQFGPADADIQAVAQWLASKGFTDIKIGAGRSVIEFSGNVAQVRTAFHTDIHQYVVKGETHLANATDPQVPAALAGVIAGVVGLHDFRKKPMYRLASTPLAITSARLPGAANPQHTFDCIDLLTSIFGSFSGQSTTCHALGPYDFATIYNVLPIWNSTPAINGAGQTIAIVGRTNIHVQDISDFRNLFGLPSNPPQVILDGPDPGVVSGDETEADVDVEWSGAVAPGASIDLVVSQSTETTDGVDLSALYIVDRNLAPIMSESYGQCEFNLGTGNNLFYNNLWQQAAAQGISVFVASGDSGSAGCDVELDQGLLPPQPAQYGLAVNGVASTPYNVAVGGTDFNDYLNAPTYWNATNNATTQASAKSYIPETTWNSSCTDAFLEDPRFRLTTNPETNCNNSGIPDLVVTVGGSGGVSSCTAPTGSTEASCAGAYAKPGWQAAPGVPAYATFQTCLCSRAMASLTATTSCAKRTSATTCPAAVLTSQGWAEHLFLLPLLPDFSLSSIKRPAINKATLTMFCTGWRPNSPPSIAIRARDRHRPAFLTT